MTVGNAAFGKIVRADVDGHTISGKDANVVFSHFTGNMGDDLVVVFELDPKHGVGQRVDNFAFELNFIFFCHVCLSGLISVGKHLGAVFGDGDGVFVMSRGLVIGGDDGPTVIKGKHIL